METALPGRRATRLAKILLDVGWWLVIVGGVLALLLTILLPVLKEGGPYWGTSLKVSIADDVAQRLMPLSSPDTLVVREPVFTDVKAVLKFDIFGFGAILLMWVVALPFFAAVIFGLHLARSFLSDVLAGKVFSTANAQRLTRLGWLLIAGGVALPVLRFFYSAVLVKRAALEGVPFSVGGGGMGIVFPGILVLVVAGAWRYGAELQKDRDLVV